MQKRFVTHHCYWAVAIAKNFTTSPKCLYLLGLRLDPSLTKLKRLTARQTTSAFTTLKLVAAVDGR